MRKFFKYLIFGIFSFFAFVILYIYVNSNDESEIVISVTQDKRILDPDLKNDSENDNSKNVPRGTIEEYTKANNLNKDIDLKNKNTSQDDAVNNIFNNIVNNEKSFLEKSNNENRRDLAIIICEVGFSTEVLKSFINNFDKNITIGINAAVKDRDYLKDLALQKKHEVFFVVPFEPIEFPDTNPGPLTILTGVTSDENIYKLNLLLGGCEGVAGVINMIGSRFIISPQDMMPIMKFFNRKELIYINAVNYENEVVEGILKSSAVKYIMLDSLFDINYATEENLKEELDSLLEELKKEGHAITIMYATQNVAAVLKDWIEKNSNQINFIKVTDYFNRYCK